MQVCNDGECPKCAAAALLTLPFDRPWQDNFFTRVVNDHLTYLNTDLSNWECNRNGRSAVGGFEG